MYVCRYAYMYVHMHAHTHHTHNTHTHMHTCVDRYIQSYFCGLFTILTGLHTTSEVGGKLLYLYL